MAKKQDFGILLFVIALLALSAAAISWVLRGSEQEEVIGGPGERVGLVEVRGVIVESEPVVQLLERFRRDKGIRAIVLRVDSPGGGVAASQEIYEEVRRVRRSGKPIVCSMGSVAASGGYYIAVGCDKIVANPGTTTGSIGVIVEIPRVDGLLKRVGVDVTVVKSGRYKDIGSPYRRMTPDERRLLQEWIDDAYDQFLHTVADARNIPADSLRAIADGRVFTGRQAVRLGLVDTLGTLRDAAKLAAELAGSHREPKLVRPARRRVGLWDVLFGKVRDLRAFLRPWPRLKYQWAG